MPLVCRNVFSDFKSTDKTKICSSEGRADHLVSSIYAPWVLIFNLNYYNSCALAYLQHKLCNLINVKCQSNSTWLRCNRNLYAFFGYVIKILIDKTGVSQKSLLEVISHSLPEAHVWLQAWKRIKQGIIDFVWFYCFFTSSRCFF